MLDSFRVVGYFKVKEANDKNGALKRKTLKDIGSEKVFE